jgi:hypothetical protein
LLDIEFLLLKVKAQIWHSTRKPQNIHSIKQLFSKSAIQSVHQDMWLNTTKFKTLRQTYGTKVIKKMLVLFLK